MVWNVEMPPKSKSEKKNWGEKKKLKKKIKKICQKQKLLKIAWSAQKPPYKGGGGLWVSTDRQTDIGEWHDKSLLPAARRD